MKRKLFDGNDLSDRPLQRLAMPLEVPDTNLLDLPSDMLREIALYVPIRELSALCSKHSKLNNAICMNRSFWAKKVILMINTSKGIDLPLQEVSNYDLETLKNISVYTGPTRNFVNPITDADWMNIAFVPYMQANKKRNLWRYIDIVPDMGMLTSHINLKPLIRIKPSDFSDNLLSIQLWDDRFKDTVENNIPHWTEWTHGTRKMYWDTPMPGKPRQVQISDQYNFIVKVVQVLKTILNRDDYKLIYYKGERNFPY